MKKDKYAREMEFLYEFGDTNMNPDGNPIVWCPECGSTKISRIPVKDFEAQAQLGVGLGFYLCPHCGKAF